MDTFVTFSEEPCARVEGSGSSSRVQGQGPGSGSRVRVQGQGPGSGSRVVVEGQGPGSRVWVQGQGPELKVLEFGVGGLGLRVEGLGARG